MKSDMSSADHLAAAIKTIYARHSAGCCQHLVLDDGNTGDSCIATCLKAWEDGCGYADCFVANRTLAGFPEDDRDLVLSIARGES